MRSLPSSVHSLNFQRKGKHITLIYVYTSYASYMAGSLPVRPPPPGAHIPLMSQYPRRISSADALSAE